MAVAILESAERRQMESKMVAFLGLLAHELRNPLTPMRTVVEILQNADADRKLDWCRGMLQRQVDRLTEVIDNLLDVARLVQGRLTLRRETVDLAAIARRAAARLEATLSSRRQKLKLDIPEHELLIHGDPERLEQILVQLLRNACKYSRTGDDIKLALSLTDRDDIVARVRDHGCGLDPDALDRLFDRDFGMVDDSHDGLGLGLQLVRHLVRLHGGQIAATSDGPGSGSEFIVRLPSAAPRENEGQAPTAPLDQRWRVLVVDDNDDAATSTATLLRRSGFEVEVARDGPQALAAVTTFQPHFVLLDIGLPGMDGFDVARQIRARIDGSTLKIVAVTGYSGERERRRAREAGIDAYLAKPFDLAQLRLILEERDPPAPT